MGGLKKMKSSDTYSVTRAVCPLSIGDDHNDGSCPSRNTSSPAPSHCFPCHSTSMSSSSSSSYRCRSSSLLRLALVVMFVQFQFLCGQTVHSVVVPSGAKSHSVPPPPIPSSQLPPSLLPSSSAPPSSFSSSPSSSGSSTSRTVIESTQQTQTIPTGQLLLQHFPNQESPKPDTRKCTDSEFECKTGGQCVPARWKCDGEADCADGSDEDEAICIHYKSCVSTDFACVNSENRPICIPQGWVCDEIAECADGRDEANCTRDFQCSIDQFTCVEGKTKKCLPLTWVCDGQSDCGGPGGRGADEVNCNATCTSNEFTCRNGKCIVNSWRCDGNNDCQDNSDELDCPKTTCIPGKDFTCANDSKCILATWRCDGESDCEDGSDEAGCPAEHLNITSSRCSSKEFECSDRITCIHNSWVCDNEPDCPGLNPSDEANCEHVTCRPDEFQCTNRECIPGHLRCNNVQDCSDGSDEICAPPKVCDRKKEFDCGGGVCISLDKVCDQKNDCGNWWDEPKEKCDTNECLVKNGNCSDICVDVRGGYYCDCKPGFELIDGHNCQDINECEIPGACSQTCTNEKGTFKCECLEGYLRDPKDHTRCKAVEGHASLLFALRHDIRKISLDHLKMTQIVESTRSATALDYMFRTGMIFWSDSLEGKIFKAPIDEGNAKVTVITDNLITSDGLAIDWIYQKLYWTDTGRKRISVAELDGKMRKVLIKDGLVEPRAIAVNPLDGWMYFSDWGSQKIERAGMDGSRRQAIVDTGLKWPNGLTLDLVHNRIFWVDAKLNSISSANFDGSDRRLILQSALALAHPFSITTFEDYVYWTDWANETIFKANKFTGKELTPILPPQSVKHVMSVHVYHAYRQPDGENHCTPLNGRCSHLCLPSPKINEDSPLFSCACPDGLLLQPDNQNCVQDPAVEHFHHGHHHGEEEEEGREEEENRIAETKKLENERRRGGGKNTLNSDSSSSSKSSITKNYDSVSNTGSKSSNTHHRTSTNKNPHQNPAELSNEVQRIIHAESGLNKPLERDYPPRNGLTETDGGTVTSIVIGCLSAIFVTVVVVVVFLYRHVFAKNGDSMNFDNPVYRKTTTEDHHISIEKNRFHKTYPSTIAEEATEPLTTSLGVNDYV